MSVSTVIAYRLRRPASPGGRALLAPSGRLSAWPCLRYAHIITINNAAEA